MEHITLLVKDGMCIVNRVRFFEAFPGMDGMDVPGVFEVRGVRPRGSVCDRETAVCAHMQSERNTPMCVSQIPLTGFATIETSKPVVEMMMMLCGVTHSGEIGMRDVNVPKALLLAEAMDVSAAARAVIAEKVIGCIRVFSRGGSSRRGLPEKAARAWLHAMVRCGAFDKELRATPGVIMPVSSIAFEAEWDDGFVDFLLGDRKGIEMWAPTKFPQVAKYQTFVDAVLGAAGCDRDRVFDALEAAYRRDMFHLGGQLRSGINQVLNMHVRDFGVGGVERDIATCTDDINAALVVCKKRCREGRMRDAADAAGGNRLAALTNYLAALRCTAADLRAEIDRSDERKRAKAAASMLDVASGEAVS